MTDNVYLQWAEAHFDNLQTVLITMAAICVFIGACASLIDYWSLAFVATSGAFLCKWSECWMLDRALTEIQRELKALEP